MSTAYLGEVRLVGFGFAPAGWWICNGAATNIVDNAALFQLIGITYGGNGQTTFNLPNLQGRIPIHQGSNGTNIYQIGQTGGAETVAVTINQYPAHNHPMMASTDAANSNNPGNQVLGNLSAYTADAPSTAMWAPMVAASNGGNQPHNNLQPYLVLNWIIALIGIFPSQS